MITIKRFTSGLRVGIGGLGERENNIWIQWTGIVLARYSPIHNSWRAGWSRICLKQKPFINQ